MNATASNDNRTVIAGGWFAMGRKFCERQAKDAANYKWQRVAFYCYAKMKAGGFCSLKAGELAEVVGTGETNLYKLIGKAVEQGWLAEGSTPTRLAVSPFDMQMNREYYGGEK